MSTVRDRNRWPACQPASRCGEPPAPRMALAPGAPRCPLPAERRRNLRAAAGSATSASTPARHPPGSSRSKRRPSGGRFLRNENRLGGAHVFRLAGFLRDDDLISHDGSFGRIDPKASREHIANKMVSQAVRGSNPFRARQLAHCPHNRFVQCVGELLPRPARRGSAVDSALSRRKQGFESPRDAKRFQYL